MNVERDFSEMIAVALRNEFGNTRHTVKTIMGWTGASERTVKNWWQRRTVQAEPT